MSAEPFLEFIEELSSHLRSVEMRRFGRAHPQTVSLFGPELKWRAHMKMEHAIFRHPSLDFATIHIYEHGTIDDPRNTIDPAVSMGRIVQESLTEITDARPFLDTEHGPIHRFKDHGKTLPQPFDDEYFRHMQWAHLASGGAGGGMRWPNRRPHSLTAGMRKAQQGLACFMPLIDWSRFSRTNASEAVSVFDPAGRVIPATRLARFACSSREQAIIYLVRRGSQGNDGQLDRRASPLTCSVKLPPLKPGLYRVAAWNTVGGQLLSSTVQPGGADSSLILPPLVGDLAVAIKRA